MLPKLTGLWRNPDFMRFWAGETVSVFGSQVSVLAIPLTAIVVLQATPVQMGWLGAAEFAPLLLLSLLAGVWIDRLPRRPVMIGSDCGLALVLGSIPLAAWWNILSIEYLYLAGFLVGGFSVLFFIAYQSYLPTLIEPKDLMEGNGKLESSRALAEVVGPALSGQLVQLITAPIAVLVDAVSFMVSAFFLLVVRKSEAPLPPRSLHRQSIRREIGEGLRELIANPLLRAFVLCNVITNFFDTLLNTVYTLYVVRELQLEPGLLGVILAVGSLGGLVGAVVAGKISQWFGFGPGIVGSTLLFGMGSLLVPLANGPLTLAITLLVVSRFVKGLVNVIYNINQISLRQTVTLPVLRGRVNASMRFLAGGVTPFGALLGGFLGSVLGLRAALAVGAIGVCLAILPIFFSPVRRLREQPEPPIQDNLAKY